MYRVYLDGICTPEDHSHLQPVNSLQNPSRIRMCEAAGELFIVSGHFAATTVMTAISGNWMRVNDGG